MKLLSFFFSALAGILAAIGDLLAPEDEDRHRDSELSPDGLTIGLTPDDVTAHTDRPFDD